MEDWTASWMEKYQLNHGMVITSYGLVPGIKPSLESLEPSIQLKKKTKLKISVLRRGLLYSKICVDDIDVEEIPFLMPLEETFTNVIQCNIIREEVVITIWKKKVCKPSQQLVKDINNALNDTNPYKSLTEVFSEYGHVICTEIIMGGRLSSAATDYKNDQEKFYKCLECIELSEESETIMQKCKDLLKKFNIDVPIFVAQDDGSYKDIYKNTDEINTWFSEKPDLWSANQPKLIPLYEILDDEKVKKQIQNLLENKQEILMTGITKLNGNKIRYYRVNFNKHILTSDDYQVIGSVIVNNKRSENLNVKFRMKSISGFSLIIGKYNLNEEIEGDLEVIWQLIGKPKSVGYFSNHTRNIKVFNTEFEIEIPEKKFSHQIEVKEELSSGFIIATSIQYPLTNYEPTLQVIVKSWFGKKIDLDIINHTVDSCDVNTQDNEEVEIMDTGETNDSDKVSVQLYIIDPNKQDPVIEDFDRKRVSWKLIGHELGPDTNFTELAKVDLKFTMALQDVRIIVAIDFGTTYSSFAYVHKAYPENLETNNSW